MRFIVEVATHLPECICVETVDPALNSRNTGTTAKDSALGVGADTNLAEDRRGGSIEVRHGTVIHTTKGAGVTVDQQAHVHLSRLGVDGPVLERLDCVLSLALRPGGIEIEDHVGVWRGVGLELEFGDDTEGRAGAAKGPEEIRVRGGGGGHNRAVGDDDLGRDESVQSQSFGEGGIAVASV